MKFWTVHLAYTRERIKNAKFAKKKLASVMSKNKEQVSVNALRKARVEQVETRLRYSVC